MPVLKMRFTLHRIHVTDTLYGLHPFQISDKAQTIVCYKPQFPIYLFVLFPLIHFKRFSAQ